MLPGGGYRYAASTAAPPAAWKTLASRVGTAGRTLQLAELLVWTTGLNEAQLGELEAYLTTKWTALPLTPSPATTLQLTLPSVDVASAGLVLWLDAAEAETLTSAGSALTRWSDRMAPSSQYLTLPVGSALATQGAIATF